MDGSVVAAIGVATGAVLSGGGAVAGAFLGRRSARQEVQGSQEIERERLGLDTMNAVIDGLSGEVARLRRQQSEDRDAYRVEIAAVRADFKACDDERRRLAADLRALNNGGT